jgi:hypothetical protein
MDTKSLYFLVMNKKKIGIVLILETMKDSIYWIRLKTTIEHFDLPIGIWNVGNPSY